MGVFWGEVFHKDFCIETLFKGIGRANSLKRSFSHRTIRDWEDGKSTPMHISTRTQI